LLKNGFVPKLSQLEHSFFQTVECSLKEVIFGFDPDQLLRRGDFRPADLALDLGQLEADLERARWG